MNRLLYIFLSCFILLMYSCSVIKQIPEGDALYLGADIKLKKTGDSVRFDKKDMAAELSDLVRPKPNKRILGIPFKLLVFNAVDTPRKDKGLKHWLKYKVGEPPVLASSVNFDKNSQLMENRLENDGYFRSTAGFDTSVKDKKLTSTFTVNITQRYKIRSADFPGDSSALSKAIARNTKQTFLKPKRFYTLDLVKQERDRIDSRLKERGFYYFSPDQLYADVDTGVGGHQVDIHVRIKRETPDQAYKRYHIRNIIVYADYTTGADSVRPRLDSSTLYKGVYVIDPEKKFNPKIFPQSLVFKKGDLYNRTDHSTSLNRLATLGVYKYVRARFNNVDSVKNPRLDAYYYLTPLPRKSLRFEASGLTKSNNASGTELTLSWRNRNTFKGAELLSGSVHGGFETQVSSAQSVSTLRFGADLSLTIPRFITPFHLNTTSAFVPQTVASLGYEFYNRTSQYTLNSFNASFGYTWKENVYKEHQLKVLSVTYVKPANITPEFQDSIEQNITLARAIEKQFIIGDIYNFNYNSQNKPNTKRNNFYFNGNLDLSNNILGLLSGADTLAGKTKYIFNTRYAQYARVEGDFRHYLKVSKNNMLASRMFVGVGYAYGNSISMPFVKAFFAGGVNSIRAFRARSLGPGTFYAGNPKGDTLIADQPGDIRLELNTELRFKLVSVLYGAAFIDAGNVWVLRDDPNKPGAKFTGDFLNQLAVGTGVGLRVDIKFFVIRGDFAFPLRKPYETDSPWQFNKLKFGNSDWRKENIVFNLAIGYPF